ncbi:hypothetical protein [Pseudomonas laurentiana]|nr:hypothetical protein [Pseudomonas laurentiana]
MQGGRCLYFSGSVLRADAALPFSQRASFFEKRGAAVSSPGD